MVNVETESMRTEDGQLKTVQSGVNLQTLYKFILETRKTINRPIYYFTNYITNAHQTGRCPAAASKTGIGRCDKK